MPLHPTIAAMLAQLAAAGRPALSAGIPDEARQLVAAGVPTTTRRYDGLPHGFIRMHDPVDTVDEALGDLAAIIARACEPKRVSQ